MRLEHGGEPGGWCLSLFRGVWRDGVDVRIGEVSPQRRLSVHTVWDASGQ